MYQAKKRGWLPWAVGLAVLLTVVALVVQMRDVLSPFIASAVLAYILNPLVGKLCRRGVGRATASMLVMVFALLLLVLLLLIVVPMLVQQFGSLLEKLPALVAFVQQKALPWLNHALGTHFVLNEESVTALLTQHLGSIRANLSKAVPALMAQGGSLVSMAGNLALLPFLLYYFLLDWARWTEGIRKMVPRRYLAAYTRIGGNMDTVLGEFLRGQLTVMLVMGLLYGLGLMLAGLESGFAIGMVAGLLVFVPYLGAFTGLLLATMAALLQFGTWQGLLTVWAVFAVGQFLESFFITPKIVGDRIGLSPFWVIFALMAFGSLFGFVGMLLALPLAAVTLVLLREAASAYMGSRFYRSEK
ncbi:AI-2E family transporter [Eikenella sp. S3360]|uniref:AI-2E family transporter n=1 Tax=Eikenella glucosivorans TaxID=2766967 RepID=A0ABS0NC84_9NEIS|nr:AI-2E family transporter [Eikenella glucosivorans]MBH5329891.1 AI-2E family transporter [Eikenella glucosivorans]